MSVGQDEHSILILVVMKEPNKPATIKYLHKFVDYQLINM